MMVVAVLVVVRPPAVVPGVNVIELVPERLMEVVPDVALSHS